MSCRIYYMLDYNTDNSLYARVVSKKAIRKVFTTKLPQKQCIRVQWCYPTYTEAYYAAICTKAY